MVYYKRKKGVSKKTKRGWYAKADLGPLGRYELGKRGLVTAVKRSVQASTMEKNVYSQTLSASALKHSTLYTYNILANIGQGLGHSNKEGRTIHLKGINMNMLVSATFSSLPTNVSDTFMRCMIVKSDQRFNPSSTSLGSGFGSDIFFDTGNPHFAYVDNTKISVLYDETIKIDNQSSNTVAIRQKVHKLHLTVDKKVTFTGDGSGNYTKNGDYYLIVIPFCNAGSTGTTTAIAGLDIAQCITFAE